MLVNFVIHNILLSCLFTNVSSMQEVEVETFILQLDKGRDHPVSSCESTAVAISFFTFYSTDIM